jgi:pyruvate/2-oxoglutarate dehydrogenase complex dihydrolipoamide acyltransferase (E2) component
VTLGTDFADKQDQAIPALVQALRERGVEKAMLVKPNGSGAGNLSVTDGRAYGLPPAVKRNDVPLPTVPVQTAPPQPAPQATPAQPARTPGPAQTAARPR